VNLRRIVSLAMALAAGLFSSAPQAALISAATPITNNASLPTYLTDGSYLFNITVNLGVDQFLLPVEIAGAAGLQTWQFDLSFDNTVVEEVDPLDGTSGIYGAQFTPGDANALSFILAGFPLNASGLVVGVAGSYPNLLSGPSGDGVLSYLLFQFLPDQNAGNPNFSVSGVQLTQVPEPGTLALFAGLLLICALFARRWRHYQPLR
jgi:hypothetical protein